MLNNPNGELTFGGVDPSKYTGTLNYVCVNLSKWQADVSNVSERNRALSLGLLRRRRLRASMLALIRL